MDDVVLSHEKEKALALAALKLPDAVDALVQVCASFDASPRQSSCFRKYASTHLFTPLIQSGANADIAFLSFSGASSVASVRLHVQLVRRFQRVLQLVQGTLSRLISDLRHPNNETRLTRK